MPHITRREGRSIHYEAIGEGVHLLMLNPAMIGSSIWHDLGYVDALCGQHRLILVDAIGCGLSSRPHEPEAYALKEKCEDTIAVLRHLEITRTNVFGYSMGGSLAYHLAIHEPDMVARLVAGGACPPGTKPLPPPGYKGRVITDEGPEVYYKTAIDLWSSVGVELSGRSKDDLKAVDFEALAARRVCHEAEAYDSEAKSKLSQITSPSLIVVGSEDPYYKTIRTSYSLIPNCTYRVINGGSHIGALVDSDAIVSELDTFLQ